MSNWFFESNRWKHFLFAIPAGMVGTIMLAIGLAVGMEFKDKQYGNKWDWIDLSCTVAGGMMGQLITIVILKLINIDLV